MNTIQKGNISKHYVIAKLIEHEFTVLDTISEDSKYDLAIDIDGKFKRIQVKTIYFHKKKNCYVLQCYSSQNNTCVENKKHKYTANEIDYIIGYNPDTQKIYVFPIEIINGRHEIYMREHYKKKQKYSLDFHEYENMFSLIR